MAPFQVSLETSQCTFSKVNGRPFERAGLILFPLFSHPRVCRYEQLVRSRVMKPLELFLEAFLTMNPLSLI